MHPGRRALCVALVVGMGLAASGCSSSSKSSGPTTSAPSTSTPPTTTPGGVFGQVGSFTVGVTTLKLPTGRALEVWYPANGAVVTGSETYDARTFLPAAVVARLGAKVHAYVSTVANRDVEVGAAGESFPLVLFSHGDAGFPDEATFLMTWLASWGFVVAAPDHSLRDLRGVLGARVNGAPSDVADLLAAIGVMRRENQARASRFSGRIQLDHIAVVGFDAGGRAAAAAAADPRIAGYVSLASDNGVGTASPPVIEPHKPSLFVDGTNDRVVPPSAAATAYRAAPAPSYQWMLSGAGHNAFDDLCILGQGGVVGLIDKSGLGGSLSAATRTLLTDGCAAPDLAVTKTWRVIVQVVTAFLRNLVGPDRTLLGVGPAGTRTVAGVKVTVAARPR